jgi:hypothetical protein
MTSDETICLWCTAPYSLRRGGSPRKFCSTRCRHKFHSCARRWAEAAIDLGILTIDDIRSGDPAACTLRLEAASRAPVAEPPWQDPGPTLPRVDSHYAAQRDLEAAMARAIALRRR